MNVRLSGPSPENGTVHSEAYDPSSGGVERAPPERAGDVLYLDLADPARSVSLNLLDVEGGADPDEVAEAFVNVGKALWQKYWGPRMLIPLDRGHRLESTWRAV